LAHFLAHHFVDDGEAGVLCIDRRSIGNCVSGSYDWDFGVD
jgi:hypothetical protein